MSNFVRIAGCPVVSGISFMHISGIYRQASPFRQFFLLMFLLITLLIFSTLIGLLMLVPIYGVSIIEKLSAISDYSDPQVVGILKYLQIVNQVGMLILPAVIFAWLVDSVPFEYLRARQVPGWRNLLLATLIVIASMPLISWFVELNEAMRLPHWLMGVEDWMKTAEDNATKITNAFLLTGSLGGFALNMLMIAILPAIGEEFLFRGVFMRLFIRWFRNNHGGVWMAAFIFSAIHMQFYGFVPRLLLGAAFGYLFIWTDNIWVPVAAHFVQNATSVVVAWLFGNGTITGSADDFGQTDNVFIIAASALLVAIFLFLVFKRRKIESENEKKDPGIQVL
ncbi:MAG TPA: CPBP family intramembrane glutamic endopeptidase [Bacteroidales bacterium]